jgi:hypothetical protein
MSTPALWLPLSKSCLTNDFLAVTTAISDAAKNPFKSKKIRMKNISSVIV